MGGGGVEGAGDAQVQQAEERMGALEGILVAMGGSKGLLVTQCHEQLQQVDEQMGELEERAGQQQQQVNARLDAEVQGLLLYGEFATWTTTD